MYIPRHSQSIVNLVLLLLNSIMLPSEKTLLEKGLEFKQLIKTTANLCEQIYKEMGSESTMDSGGAWFKPFAHPFITAVRKQEESAWQIKEKGTTVSYTRSDSSEHLHLRVEVFYPEKDSIVVHTASLRLRFPQKDAETHRWEIHQITTEQASDGTGKKHLLAEKQENIVIPDVIASFFTPQR